MKKKNTKKEKEFESKVQNENGTQKTEGSQEVITEIDIKLVERMIE